MIILFGFLFTLQVLEMLNSVNPAKQQLNEKENERKIAAERSEFTIDNLSIKGFIKRFSTNICSTFLWITFPFQQIIGS